MLFEKRDVNILGTKYTIEFVNYYDDADMKEKCGYCSEIDKRIVICNYRTLEGCERESEEYCAKAEKLTLRHEIFHAFLNESGLSTSSLEVEGAWAKNEEMIDWLAIQSPKIYRVFQELDIF